MGSGAFLVEACRQLGDELVAAWHANDCLPVIPPDEDERKSVGIMAAKANSSPDSVTLRVSPRFVELSAKLEAFAQLGTELDKATQAQLDRGFRMVEILKQPQYQPMPIEEQVVVIWAGGKGKLDGLAVENLAEFESGLLQHLRDQFPEILQEIRDKGEMSDELEGKLSTAIDNFTKDFKPGA